MRNTVIKTVFGNLDWIAPAGIFEVKVQSTRYWPAGRFNGATWLDFYSRALAQGLNTNGQLGIGSVAATSSPTLVVGGLTFKKTLYGSNQGSSAATAYGLTTDGKIYGWGRNDFGQIGAGNTTTVSSPVLVVGGLSFQDVKSNDDGTTAVGLTTGGAVYTWGSNNFGQLGNSSATQAFSSPVLVVGGLQFRWVDLAGKNSGSATTSGGVSTGADAYMWGENSAGQLGDGTSANKSSPVLVLGGLKWGQLVLVGGTGSVTNRTHGLTVDGLAYSWGNNSKGSLGTGNNSDIFAASSPVAVLGGLVFKKLYANSYGSRSTYGLTRDGKAYAWGINGSGELGDGTIVAKSSPVLVLGGLNFRKLHPIAGASGSGWILGITNDGDMYQWGSVDNGLNNKSSPVLVTGGLKWKDVWGTNDMSVFGVTSDGLLYAWGDNTNGQLGTGNTTTVSSPVQVLGGLSAKLLDDITIQSIPVIPGTTYKIKFGAAGVQFGSYSVGQQQVEAINLIY